MKYPLLLLFLLILSCTTNNSDTSNSTITNKTSTEDSDKFIKQVAITIDDLPVVTRLQQESIKTEVTKRILANLKQFDAPAIGFVNEGKMYKADTVSTFQEGLLQQWLDAGMELGNHTLRHPSYHRTDFEAYAKQIKDGEKITSRLLTQKNRKLKYFRHPFLHTGNTPEKKKQLEDFLEQEGYIVAPVTIDNSDWIYAAAYDRAMEEQDSEMMKKLGESFVDYIDSKFAYYETQSKKLFDRNIAHTLLLHANTINADYLDDLLARLKERGYEFITLTKALEDKAYESESTYTGNGGISWLDRWALTRGKGKIAHYFRAEPRCPEFVQEYSGLEE